jgi:hypothetical protein
MKKREWISLGLHIVIGAALTATVMWHILMINFAVFVYASLREQAQHRWILEGEPGAISTSGRKLYHANKRTFFDFGWLGKKQVAEIAQWVLGSAVVSIPWYYFG